MSGTHINLSRSQLMRKRRFKGFTWGDVIEIGLSALEKIKQKEGELEDVDKRKSQE